MSKTIHQPPVFQPQLLILINGKRKSGKDYFTQILLNRFSKDDTAIIHIANPIKHYWAVTNNLDEKLLDTSSYKEEHREKMVAWSQEVRKDNWGYFNLEAIKMSKAAGKPIWICVDIRHKEDYKWFLEFYPTQVKRVRVVAKEDVRISRGWIFTPGVDDGPSECDLDDVTDWDLVVTNNSEPEDSISLDKAVETIVNWVPSSLKSDKE